MNHEEFNAYREVATTPSGQVAYVSVGKGPPALFVHGVFTNGHLWRHVIERAASERRCLAIDLPGHGHSPAAPDQDLSLPALARLLEDFCDALGLGPVDVVANDTGGAVVQVLAANNPERLRTLTFTNCDVHDQIPPDAFREGTEAAARGELAPAVTQFAENPGLARRSALGQSYEHPEEISDETIREYFAPFADPEGARQLERAVNALNAEDLIAVEPKLEKLEVPTLIVWGSGDVFFDVKWAHWLRDRIPGAGDVVELPDARLFYPEERADDLVPHLLAHWRAHAPAGVAW
jgi:pimeloyl-ACP methyl ester carboxylesterase